MRGGTIDAYAVLGVAPDASQDALEAAYKARLTLLHPDRMAGRSQREQEVAAAMLAELQEAWALVGDARSRARYDSEREREQQAQQQAQEDNGAWGPPAAAEEARSAWERAQDDAERRRALLEDELRRRYGAPLGRAARRRSRPKAPLLTTLAVAVVALAGWGVWLGHPFTAGIIVVALLVGSRRGRRLA